MSSFEPSKNPDSGPPSGEPDPTIWTPRRQYLLDWFRREAPSLAPAYEAAVRILNMRTMPAKVHLVCHVVRDIYTKLPQILDGEYRRKEPSQTYPNLLKKLDACWTRTTKSPVSTDDPPASPADRSNDVRISGAAARAVESLLEAYHELKEQPRSVAILARALYRRYAEAGFDVPHRLVDKLERERRWFVAGTHLVEEAGKLPTDDDLKEHFALFENALYSLVGEYFAGKKEIDDVLQQANQAAG